MFTLFSLDVFSVYMRTIQFVRYWTRLPAFQRIAYASGFVIMLTGIAHLMAFPLINDATWSGPTGFRKSIVFGLSGGFTLVTLSWLLSYFPAKPKLHTSMMVGMSATMIIEIIIIDLQRHRGVYSHFNMATPLDSVLWSIMGISILSFALLATIQTILSFGKLKASPAMKIAIRLSMLVFFLSQISGQLIVIHGLSVVFQEGQFIYENIAKSTTFGEGGNLKLPHALSLHAIQVIPLLGLTLNRIELKNTPSKLLIWINAVGFLGLVVLAQVQAYKGKLIHQLDTFSAVIAWGCLFLLLVPNIYASVTFVTGKILNQGPAKNRIEI
ncbi:hypothetical protein MLD52_10885 [Puniceicoccaceae bacterium K14]|nr:hypothetical protein [Puniceicoccaceae bacterium K14]